MNCKKGDMAVVIRCGYFFPKAVGMIVQCLEFKPYKGCPAWKVSPRVGPDVVFMNSRLEGDWLMDRDLRPLGYYGEDEVDETLLGIPVPVEEMQKE